MAPMPMEKFQDKIPIKKVTQSLGNVAIGSNGYSDRVQINTIQGYRLLSVSLANFASIPGKNAITVTSANNSGILIIGNANTTITNVSVECVYVSDDYATVSTS